MLDVFYLIISLIYNASDVYFTKWNYSTTTWRWYAILWSASLLWFRWIALRSTCSSWSWPERCTLSNSTSDELIFLSISHTNFGNDPERLPSRVASIIQNNLEPYLYMPPNPMGMKDFDFQNFGSLILSSITTTGGFNGTSPKVIVPNTDNSNVYYYKDTVVNTRGFADSGRWKLNANGVNSLSELVEVESQGLKKNIKSMYHRLHKSWIFSWTLLIISVESHPQDVTKTTDTKN